MKITAEKDQQSQYIVRIEIDPEELDAAKGKAAKRLSTRLRIPGFRPGKAPRALVERFVGQEGLIEEASKDLMPKAYKEALSQENIKPIADPDFKIDSLNPLTIIATIPVEPTVNLGNYKEIKFEMPETVVNPEEVDKTIQQLRDQNSTWEEPEEERPAQEGDQVDLELQTYRDGQPGGEPFDRTGVLGKGEILEQVDGQVVGMRPGEERIIEIQRHKPAETAPDSPPTADQAEGEAAAIAASQANTEANAAADTDESAPALPQVEIIPLSPEEEEIQDTKPLTFRVKLNSVKVKHEPELNDDFAASVSDLKTMDELTQRVRTNLQSQNETKVRRELVDKIVKEAVALSQIEMPPVMIEAEIHALEENMVQRLKQQKLSLDQYLMFSSKSHEDFHAELRPQAEDRIRTALVLRDIANQEGITVDQGDLDREVEKMVDEYTLNAAENDREEQVNRLRTLFNRKETRDRLTDDIFSRKLGDRLIELATGVKPVAEEAAEINLKNDPNAATQASEEKLELTQGAVETSPEVSPAAETGDVANPANSNV